MKVVIAGAVYSGSPFSMEVARRLKELHVDLGNEEDYYKNATDLFKDRAFDLRDIDRWDPRLVDIIESMAPNIAGEGDFFIVDVPEPFQLLFEQSGYDAEDTNEFIQTQRQWLLGSCQRGEKHPLSLIPRLTAKQAINGAKVKFDLLWNVSDVTRAWRFLQADAFYTVDQLRYVSGRDQVQLLEVPNRFFDIELFTLVA